MEGYKSPEEMQGVRKEGAGTVAKQKAEDAAKQADRARFEAVSPEEKANERLARYMAIQGILGHVSAEQREQKRLEYLAEYQLQEESKIS